MTKVFILFGVICNVLALIEISVPKDEDLSPIILVHGGAGSISSDNFQAKVKQVELKHPNVLTNF